MFTKILNFKTFTLELKIARTPRSICQCLPTMYLAQNQGILSTPNLIGGSYMSGQISSLTKKKKKQILDIFMGHVQ